jgi:hypothetical protein
MGGIDETDQAVSSTGDALITAELAQRVSRPPDHAAESRALGALAQAMAVDASRVMQRCAELALELCEADSAGVSILESGGTPSRARSPHTLTGPSRATKVRAGW